MKKKINSLQWQKIKTTLDDGNIQRIDNPDFTNPQSLLANSSGIYYVYQANVTGTGIFAQYGYLQISKASNSNYAEMIFRPFSNSQINKNESYIVKKSGDTWSKWNKMDISQTDTGWITFDLINGAKSNTAYKNEGDGGFDCAYRTITNGSEVTKKLRINGTNLTPNQVIAQLPKNFAKNTQAFPVRVPTSSAGGYIVIRPSGVVNFYVSGDRSNWDETGYAYGECTWND